MGRIARVQENSDYAKLRSDSDAMNERGDCSVVAVAAVTGVPYNVAHKAMSDAGRRRGTGAHMSQIERAVESLGYKMNRIDMRDKIRQYPGRHATALSNVTTHHPDRFKHVWADGNIYIFSTRSHVAAVVNGENVDWTKGRAKRCVAIYKVTQR